jgi:D-serine deaminase-like pyridoxal phosphate-dependent protein
MATLMVVAVREEDAAQLREIARTADITFGAAVERAIALGVPGATTWAKGQRLAATIAASRPSDHEVERGAQ